jgi:hypothetical protein
MLRGLHHVADRLDLGERQSLHLRTRTAGPGVQRAFVVGVDPCVVTRGRQSKHCAGQPTAAPLCDARSIALNKRRSSTASGPRDGNSSTRHRAAVMGAVEVMRVLRSEPSRALDVDSPTAVYADHFRDDQGSPKGHRASGCRERRAARAASWPAHSRYKRSATEARCGCSAGTVRRR